MSSLHRRRFLQLAATASALTVAQRPLHAAAQPLRPDEGVWLAGDLHCHSIYSHDVWSPGNDNTGNDEFYTWGHTPGEQITNAEIRGLDFLAVTDHNDVRSAHAPDYASQLLTLLPGYEHSLWGGHAGVFVPRLEDLAVIEDPVYGRSFEGDAAFARFLAAVAERDGMVVANHPYYKGSRTQRTWRYGEDATAGVAAVEAWNSAWFLRYETSPLYDNNNDLAVQWWEAHFAARRAMVGGSDNHWRTLDNGGGVGQPTTWVYARDRSPAAILEGVSLGRTFVSSQPPALGGAGVVLSATETWQGGATAAVGGQVRGDGPLLARVVVTNGSGARLRLVATDPATGTGRVVAEQLVLGPSETIEHPVTLAPGGALRAELYDDQAVLMRAMTSAIAATGSAPIAVRTQPSTGPQVSYDFGPPALELADGAAAAVRAQLLPACACDH
jgi:hypothetical protein